MWERRYGSPQSIRLPSGHRRYPMEEVERLKAVALALKQGYRAREVASASHVDLQRMIERSRRLYIEEPNRESTGHGSEPDSREIVDQWIRMTVQYDEEGLTNALYDDWGKLGPLRFLTDRLHPYLVRLGEDWRIGEVSVSHEHFASERIVDFLASQWRKLNERNEEPPILLTSLPGDQHRLGLQIASVTIAAAGRKVLNIGAMTPAPEVIRAAESHQPAAIAFSVSITMDAKQVRRAIEQVRIETPRSIPIVAGGSGAPTGIDGVEHIVDIAKFYEWVRRLPAK